MQKAFQIMPIMLHIYMHACMRSNAYSYYAGKTDSGLAIYICMPHVAKLAAH